MTTILLPLLRERFPGRGRVEGAPPEAVAAFPGVHPGIRRVAVYEDGGEFIVCVDDHTHGHFADYDDDVPSGERDRRVIESVLDFLAELFADRVAVWSVPDISGGWYRVDLSDGGAPPGVPVFVWSGPLGRS